MRTRAERRWKTISKKRTRYKRFMETRANGWNLSRNYEPHPSELETPRICSCHMCSFPKDWEKGRKKDKLRKKINRAVAEYYEENDE